MESTFPQNCSEITNLYDASVINDKGKHCTHASLYARAHKP